MLSRTTPEAYRAARILPNMTIHTSLASVTAQGSNDPPSCTRDVPSPPPGRGLTCVQQQNLGRQ